MNVGALRSTQSGAVLTSADHGYADAVRKWGPPAAPDVLVRPANPAEIGAALRWAVTEEVEVAVRSGGHGVWAPLPGGLLIDLDDFAQVEVAEGGIARVGAGALWGDVADALAPHGLALTSGDTRTVGVGGNALAAGIGWLVRSVGLSVDQLVAAEIVTADGRVVTASDTENADLFFGIRGGGGNFGVVTRFDFRAAPVERVVHGTAAIEVDQLAAAIRGVRDAMRGAPRELAVTLVKPPPMGPDPVPPPMLQIVWAGPDEDAARAALAPLLAAPGVGAAELEVAPYGSALVDPPEPPGPPPRSTSSNGVFARLPDETADRAVAALAEHPGTLFSIRFLGGALADVPADATPLGWRDAEAIVQWIAFLAPDSSDDEVARVHDLWAPVGEGGDALCGTFTYDTGPDIVEQMYSTETLKRLREVKRTWDPDNLFRRNHNIVPA